MPSALGLQPLPEAVVMDKEGGVAEAGEEAGGTLRAQFLVYAGLDPYRRRSSLQVGAGGAAVSRLPPRLVAHDEGAWSC